MSKLKLIIGGLLAMALSLVVPQSPFTSVAESQVYPPVRCAISLSASVVPQGATISVSANCFLPGSAVQVILSSTPRVLGTFTADARGVISGRVTIPCDVPVGAHTVSAQGVDASGKPLRLSAALRVVDGCPVGAAPRVVTGGGALSKTGSNLTMPLTAAGIALLATGTAAVVVARRRRAAQAS